MPWFYALDGRQAGPVDDAQLDRLAADGAVTPATLVWQSGMAAWLPYAQARPAPARAPYNPLTDGPLAAGQAQCSQCGRVLPADEVVRVEDLNVCGDCKPALLQRLREGMPVRQAGAVALTYAGFWIRLGAVLLDGLILIPFYLVLFACMWYFTDLHTFYEGLFRSPPVAPDPSVVARMTRQIIPLSLASNVLLTLYNAFCIHRFGGTPGKRICNLRVVHGTVGGRVSFLRALGRYAAQAGPITLPSLLAGVLPVFVRAAIVYGWFITDPLCLVFDDQKRALHDRIAGTRVVSEDPLRR